MCPGHHQTREVGRRAHRDVHADVEDVLSQDLERLHTGPILPAPLQPLPIRSRPVSFVTRNRHHALNPLQDELTKLDLSAANGLNFLHTKSRPPICFSLGCSTIIRETEKDSGTEYAGGGFASDRIRCARSSERTDPFCFSMVQESKQILPDIATYRRYL